jgi:hypothetical protein
MSTDLLLDRASHLYRELADAVGGQRGVFVAGLPGVGKSLLIQQLALIAGEAGRRVHLLQWDVARGAFETPTVLARYPEVDGITHAAIRKAAGFWVRRAIADWDRTHPGDGDLLLGEAPLIGNRLSELAQPQDDPVEALLAGSRSLFLVPAPTAELRQAIERVRAREMSDPLHERERANANPGVIRALWDELALVADRLGVSGRPATTEYDTERYVRAYQRLLRYRQARVLWLRDLLPVRGSPHVHTTVATELVPSVAEVAEALAHAEALAPDDLRRQVERWYAV